MFQTLDATPLVVFDTETTGLSPFGDDRIIEIAAAKVINGEIVDTFEAMVNPERSIPFTATQVNKISDDMVADAPTMEEVWPAFKEFIGEDGVLVAHNSKFDMDYLVAFFDRNGMDKSELPECICTMKMSRNFYSEEKGHSLKAVAARLGVEMDDTQAHRALYDVKITAEVMQKMITDSGSGMVMDLMF